MTDTNEIWVVDDDSSIRWVIEKALSGEEIPCRTFECAADLLSALESDSPKAIISDIRMPVWMGSHYWRSSKQRRPIFP